jgi:SAM-dependent methyltransferase
MSVAPQGNTEIWDRVYQSGRSLWYPYEVAVRLVRRHLERHGFRGVLLDHGCGSGNHLEFFARLGIEAHGTEVAQSALALVRSRFEGAKLRQPAVSLVDPERPLAEQLPSFDHLFAWGSVHYDAKPRVLKSLGTLIGKLPAGGAFFFAVPTTNDIVYRLSEPQADGSRRISGNLSGQKGAVVSIPGSQEEVRDWCAGIQVRDLGTFGWTLDGEQVEYFFVYGVAS